MLVWTKDLFTVEKCLSVKKKARVSVVNNEKILCSVFRRDQRDIWSVLFAFTYPQLTVHNAMVVSFIDFYVWCFFHDFLYRTVRKRKFSWYLSVIPFIKVLAKAVRIFNGAQSIGKVSTAVKAVGSLVVMNFPFLNHSHPTMTVVNVNKKHTKENCCF